jgi:hypothetical protein
MNTGIVYIRAYNGSLIPISKVNLVTTDPNTGKVVQEVSLQHCIEKLMYHNMNNFEKIKDDWKNLDNYSIVENK